MENIRNVAQLTDALNAKGLSLKVSDVAKEVKSRGWNPGSLTADQVSELDAHFSVSEESQQSTNAPRSVVESIHQKYSQQVGRVAVGMASNFEHDVIANMSFLLGNCTTDQLKEMATLEGLKVVEGNGLDFLGDLMVNSIQSNNLNAVMLPETQTRLALTGSADTSGSLTSQSQSNGEN